MSSVINSKSDHDIKYDTQIISPENEKKELMISRSTKKTTGNSFPSIYEVTSQYKKLMIKLSLSYTNEDTTSYHVVDRSVLKRSDPFERAAKKGVSAYDD